MENNNVKEKQSQGCGGSCLVAILMLFLVIGCIAWIFQATVNTENTDRPSLISRKASLRDVDVSSRIDSLVAVELKVIPKHDIDNLEITVYCYDKNDQLIKTVTKYFGDVEENGRYEESIYITDFSVSQLLQIDYCEYTVTGGTVSYFD